MEDEIKEYWEKATPMSFDQEGWTYQQKRAFRYELQNYMNAAFQFKNWKGKKVLDFGCGSGIDAVEFARYGAEVTAVDITRNACDLTFALANTAGVSHILVIRILPNIIPFPDDYFDLVYSFGVLHHIPDVEKTLTEIKRVLKPSGKFMGMVYNRESLLFAYSIIHLHRRDRPGELPEDTWKYLLSKYSERNEGCPYTMAYTKNEAEGLFSQFFKQVDVSVHYNVIDTPEQRKVKFELDKKGLNLGWHLVIKATK